MNLNVRCREIATFILLRAYLAVLNVTDIGLLFLNRKDNRAASCRKRWVKMILDPVMDLLQGGIKSVSLSTRHPVCLPSSASLWNEKKVPLFLGPARSLSAASSTLVIFFYVEFTQQTRWKPVTSGKREHVSIFACRLRWDPFRWMRPVSWNFVTIVLYLSLQKSVFQMTDAK